MKTDDMVDLGALEREVEAALNAYEVADAADSMALRNAADARGKLNAAKRRLNVATQAIFDAGRRKRELG